MTTAANLQVETRPDGVIIYRVNAQDTQTLAAWENRVTGDLAQPPGQAAKPRRIIHDLRGCGMPNQELLARLRKVAAAGREQPLCCAVLVQSALMTQIVEYWTGVKEPEGAETPLIGARQVLSPDTKLSFHHEFEKALHWILFSCHTGDDSASLEALSRKTLPRRPANFAERLRQAKDSAPEES